MSSAGHEEGSEERQARAHEQTVELFRLLIDHVRDYAIFTLDLDGRVASWNKGAELLKGYVATEIIGRHVECFYMESDRRANKPVLLLKQAREEGRVEDEGWRVRKDGTRFWANVVITALYDEKGTLCGYAEITRDLTERREAEEALKAEKNELEKRVLERTSELERMNIALRERLDELEQFHDAVVDRELKMIKLEKEVENLRRRIEQLTAGGEEPSS